MSPLIIPVFAALVFPPTITKTFSPSTVAVSQTSTMTITITNPNTSDLTGARMGDVFPPQLLSAGPVTTTCPGSSVSLTSPPIRLDFFGTIPANSTCTITTLVFSTTPGIFQNDTGNLFSIGPSSLRGGTDTLIVLATIPALPAWALAVLALLLAALGWVTSSSSS